MKVSSKMVSRSRESSVYLSAKVVRTASALGLLFCIIGCADDKHSLPATLSAPNELTLDAADPVMTVTVAGRQLRLLVDAAQADTIELDSAVADRLPLTWAKGRDLEIGRVLLPGRTAQTILEVDGRRAPVLVSTHERAVGQADGLIGPDLLPFATIRWRWPDAPPATAALTMPLTMDRSLGLVTQDTKLPLPIRLRFALLRPDSEATAAAGSFLAQRYGGRFEGVARKAPVLLGVTRPVRPLAFDRAPVIAGFRFPRLSVRISDFRGENPLPTDPVQPDEIVVARREPPQPAQSWVTIASDRLRRCAEITYVAKPRSLTLRCAFD